MTFIDKLVEIFLKIRWEKIQSVSSYVVLFGISLIGFNYWNWAWDVFFKPAGFQREGNQPAIFGLILIALGLFTLVADKFASRIVPATFEQDKRIYNHSIQLCSWDAVDFLLNDLYSLFFRSTHKSAVVTMVRFLENEQNEYTNPQIKSECELLLKSAKQLLIHLGNNFTGPSSLNSDIIDWNLDKYIQPGEPKYAQMKEKSDELKKLSNQFEKSFQSYQKAANKLGLVEMG